MKENKSDTRKQKNAKSGRDLLDIMESYKYMNTLYALNIPYDGRWDYARGWLEKNLRQDIWISQPSLQEEDFFDL